MNIFSSKRICMEDMSKPLDLFTEASMLPENDWSRCVCGTNHRSSASDPIVEAAARKPGCMRQIIVSGCFNRCNDSMPGYMCRSARSRTKTTGRDAAAIKTALQPVCLAIATVGLLVRRGRLQSPAPPWGAGFLLFDNFFESFKSNHSDL